MQITHIKARDFLGLKFIDIDLAPVTLICGENWSGKSSIQNAIRYCLLGELTRVRLKGESGQLVRDGAKSAEIVVHMLGIDNLGAASKVRRTLSAKGKAEVFAEGATVDEVDALPYLLNPPLLLSASDDERFDLLFRLSRGWDPGNIAAAMIQRGADKKFVMDRVVPMLRSDVGSAHTEAGKYAAEARGRWKAATGETYGSQKAEDWEPTQTDKRLSAGEKQKRAASLALAEKELAEFAPRYEIARALTNMDQMTCPDCGSIFDPRVTPQAMDAAASLDEVAKSRDMLARMVENRKGLVQAGALLDEAYERENKDLAARAKNAKEAHGEVKAWEQIAEMLSPSGIPLELAQGTVELLNAVMSGVSKATGWGRVALHADGRITYNERLIDLCSEAQRWLCGVILAHAIGLHCGCPILMVDRMDVLMVKARGPFIRWCQARGEDAQTIVFATLKSKPELGGVASYWLSDGEIQ